MMHSYEGTVYFNKMPLVYVDRLDGYTVTDGNSNAFEPDPIWCVDWSKLLPVVQDGYWMEEGKPAVNSNQHTTLTVYLDGSHNNLCTNRRTVGFVLHKMIPAAA
jgi:hypothetical protein